MAMNLPRLFRTLRYLKLQQIIAGLIFRTRPIRIRGRCSLSQRSVPGPWTIPVAKTEVDDRCGKNAVRHHRYLIKILELASERPGSSARIVAESVSGPIWSRRNTFVSQRCFGAQ